MTHKSHYSETFYVPSDLFGLVIGVKGATLQAARRLDGIVQITINDSMQSIAIAGEVSEDVTVWLWQFLSLIIVHSFIKLVSICFI